MLLLIGLGLTPPGSLSLEAWEALQSADKVYLELYTSAGISAENFAEFLKRPVIAANRALVESDRLITEAAIETIALCVIGDVFSATTHSVLALECMRKDIACKAFPNAGIINGISVLGLELYKYGQTVSIPYPMLGFNPDSYLAKIASNQAAGLHTLVLLDIKADENRFMTIPEAADLLEGKLPITLAIGVARLGFDTHVFAGSLDELRAHKWPAPLHSIVIPGILNAVEQEFVELWQRPQ